MSKSNFYRKQKEKQKQKQKVYDNNLNNNNKSIEIEVKNIKMQYCINSAKQILNKALNSNCEKEDMMKSIKKAIDLLEYNQEVN